MDNVIGHRFRSTITPFQPACNQLRQALARLREDEGDAKSIPQVLGPAPDG